MSAANSKLCVFCGFSVVVTYSNHSNLHSMLYLQIISWYSIFKAFEKIKFITKTRKMIIGTPVLYALSLQPGMKHPVQA
jgi:hypothetical protein